MKFGMGPGRVRVAPYALAMLVSLMPASGLYALDATPPDPKPKPVIATNPNAKPEPSRIPDAFEPRLDSTDDDKDAPAGETVALPPMPSTRPAAKPKDQNSSKNATQTKPAEAAIAYDPNAFEIDFEALQTLYSAPAIVAPTKPAETTIAYDPKAFEIDFEALQALYAAKKSPESIPKINAPAAMRKPKLPDLVREVKLPGQVTDTIELVLSLETPRIRLGEDASFALSGPDDFLLEATGDYVIGDDLGRQLARGQISLRAIPTANGQPKRFKLPVPTELMLPAEKYKGGRAGLKLHADFAFASPGKKTVKLGADIGLDTPAEPRLKEWDGWIALTSNPPVGGAWEKLNALGIFGGMQIRTSAARRESLRRGNAPFYVENVTRQLLSRYHTEKGLWQKTIAAMSADRNGGTTLSREPSLSSPAFADAFGGEIARIAEAYAAEPPLFFSLASEPSMTRLNAAADFDFSPAALDEFRRWLERDAYGTLPALNESWGTRFETWQAVVPMTTDDARMRLKDGVGNFAPWADFREFQDYTFAKVLREGADLLRTKIPNAKVGITGAMGPFAFGGWDWSRLALDLDIVEAYDIGGARALWRDLAPGKPALAALTLPPDGNAAAAPELNRTLWQFALDGGPRGALFWDVAGVAANDSNPGGALIDAHGEPTELVKALAPALGELNGVAGQLLGQSQRANDGVALLYSPASVRVQWLFEADNLHGAEWLQTWGADSSAERRESQQLRLRESWGKLLDDCGVGWRFMSSHQLEHGELVRAEAGIKTLILPRAIALSDREAEAIKQFSAAGGRVIADAACARFDEHGKIRARPALDELFGVNTSSEPIFAKPMKPLNRITPVPGDNGPMAKWDAEFCGNLPPVFSDEPKWLDPERSGKRKGAEYRLSPVFASRNNALYLNLDLTDYLRWRLHPELPRALTLRKALQSLVFKQTLDAGPIDWNKTQLPHGTQIVRLRLGNAAKSGYLLALRRNPQARLHELGVEGDGNWAFDKAEPFELHFKANVWLSGTFPAGAGAAAHAEKTESVRKIAGTLDPVKPSIFLLHAGEPDPLKLSAVESIVKLQRIEIAVERPKESASPALFSIRIVGPDRVERPHYGGTVAVKDGALSHIISFALNDPPGTWTVAVRDALSGAAAEIRVQVKDSE